MANAFHQSLERIIIEERVRFGRRLAFTHLLMGMVAGPLSIYVFATAKDSRLIPTAIAMMTIPVLAVPLWFASRNPRISSQLGWVIPLFDVPFVVFGQMAQYSKFVASGLPLPVSSMVVTTMGMTFGVTALSMLSLSRRIVLATIVLAGAHLIGRLITLQVELVPSIMGLAAFTALGITMLFIVRRVSTLIVASRQNDLMGKYVLGRRLGSGGMAEVFEATYSPEGGFERRVAVKKVLAAAAQNVESMELFRREAEIGALLAHPNIVQVLDFGSVADTYFMAMEFVDGVPLTRVLNLLRASNESFPIVGVVHLARQLAEALDYVHERLSPSGTPLSLVHRDVNPPNVMVTRIGDVKLADFGIARSSNHASMTSAGVLRGKLAYVAPEQVRQEPYDHRADLFALGAVLYETLTSRRAFAGVDTIALLHEVVAVEPPPVSSLRADVPAGLIAAVEGLLKKDLAARMSRAAELRVALAALPAEFQGIEEGRRVLGALAVRAMESTSELVAALDDTTTFDGPTGASAIPAGLSKQAPGAN